jgi:hypothetical protein
MAILILLLLAFGVFLALELNPRQKRRAALMAAISRNDLREVELIVASNLNLNFNHTWQFMRVGSPLARAVGRSDRSIADFLIARGASLSPKSPGNEALLTIAVGSLNPELVDLVLAAGHDIHFKPPNRSTPLARAIHHQWIPMARFLVSRGAGKKDFGRGDCRWHAMQGATILFVRELGMDVPQNVLTAIENGEWDRRPTPKGA